jgi:hypothetical protein
MNGNGVPHTTTTDAPSSLPLWKKVPSDAKPGDYVVHWTPTVQRITAGAESFVHEGPIGRWPSYGVARLLLTASAPLAPWRPIGSVVDVRLAEFSALAIETLLDLVLVSVSGHLRSEEIPARLLAATGDGRAAELHCAPREALARLLAAMDDRILVRLSPYFFRQRTADRSRAPSRGADIRFRLDQPTSLTAHEAALQTALGAQLERLRALGIRAKTVMELSADELIFQTFRQPDRHLALEGQEEIFRRVRQASEEAERLAGVVRIVAQLYPLVKPACVTCMRPATQLQGGSPSTSATYACDEHAPEGARDLPAADVIRAAAFVASQLDEASSSPLPPVKALVDAPSPGAPSAAHGAASVSNGSNV